MGVLSGYKIVEFAGIGPAPMCAMLLSDMGAEVLRLHRAEGASLGTHTGWKSTPLGRGREPRNPYQVEVHPAGPRPPLGGDRPQAPRGHRTRAQIDRAGRRAA